ncbi:MAG: cobalt ECF transporter T component CbiQ [Actinobacteria bacterium QS_8_72_14]|nr:MAG: cobalt ECF transporter T component CbiQ [Actinobacteria bacterium QS_8_72_14]
MGAGHTHALYVHEHSVVHRLAPEVKIAAAFAFVFAAALTPRHAVWAFAIDAVALATVITVARLPVRFVLARMLVVVPFVAFAVTIPFIGSGERVDVLGVAVSQPGLWATWNIVAKATLGVAVSVTLAATTEIAALLRGLERLRVPAPLTQIASFMVRYLELIAGDLTRMRRAMSARGHDPRWLWQIRPLAACVGSLFIRAYERGERVYAAMRSRGYTGAMPVGDVGLAPARQWLLAANLPLIAGVAAGVALVMGP